MSTISESGESAGDFLSQGINTVSSLTTNVTTMTKQRVKLNMKVLGMQIGQNQQDATGATQNGAGQTVEKQTVRESFSAPQMSIISKLMTKVIQ